MTMERMMKPPPPSSSLLLPPSFSPNPNPNALIQEEDRLLALEMARDSLVLLKNDQHLLPLNPNDDIKILVTGQGCDSIRHQVGGGGGGSSSSSSSNRRRRRKRMIVVFMKW